MCENVPFLYLPKTSFNMPQIGYVRSSRIRPEMDAAAGFIGLPPPPLLRVLNFDLPYRGILLRLSHTNSKLIRTCISQYFLCNLSSVLLEIIQFSYVSGVGLARFESNKERTWITNVSSIGSYIFYTYIYTKQYRI